MWWVYLLVRRNKSFVKRCRLFKQIVLCGVRLPWWERCQPLLVKCTTKYGKYGVCFITHKGKFHRTGDLPAVVSETHQVWVLNGDEHRDVQDEVGRDLPAFIGLIDTQIVKNGIRFSGLQPRE